MYMLLKSVLKKYHYVIVVRVAVSAAMFLLTCCH
jgi:hypothetical protein